MADGMVILHNGFEPIISLQAIGKPQNLAAPTKPRRHATRQQAIPHGRSFPFAGGAAARIRARVAQQLPAKEMN